MSRDARSAPVEAGESLYEGVVDVLMTGVAIIVPLVITVFVLDWVLDVVTDALRPVVDLLKWMGAIQWFQDINFIAFLIRLDVYGYVIDFLGELIAVIVLVGIVIVVGSLGQHRYGQRVVGYLDLFISSIPGAGTVYKSFRRMGDVMLDEGSENFEEVKLVKCLGDDIYMLGFETGQTPTAATTATGHEDMVTMFLPLAPNPVTGGYLTYVPESRVYDIEMTVEEGIRSIVTSGVAIGEDDPQMRGLTEAQMRELGQVQRIDNQVGTADSDDVGREETMNARREEYDEEVSPEHSDTPAAIEARTGDATVGEEMRHHDQPDEVSSEDVIGETAEGTPAERAGRSADRAERTSEKTPAEMADRDPERRDETGDPPADREEDDA